MMKESGQLIKHDKKPFVLNMNLKIFKDPEALAVAAAETVIAIMNKAVAEKGSGSLVLSGGETPKQMYRLLAEDKYSKRLPWESIYIFWGDERCVGLTDDRNNAFHAKEILLDNVPIPAKNIFRVPVDLQPEAAAQNYERVIRDFFGSNQIQFDLILLGLGENGHTASLFPNSPVLNDLQVGVRDVFVAEENMYRITMTAPLLNKGYHVLCLVQGKSKSTILTEIVSSSTRKEYPFQLIQPEEGTIELYVDEDAASLLT